MIFHSNQLFIWVKQREKFKSTAIQIHGLMSTGNVQQKLNEMVEMVTNVFQKKTKVFKMS